MASKPAIRNVPVSDADETDEYKGINWATIPFTKEQWVFLMEAFPPAFGKAIKENRVALEARISELEQEVARLRQIEQIRSIPKYPNQMIGFE